jgi:ABC-type branched-subunit amino acid transport system substrate-binding protein
VRKFTGYEESLMKLRKLGGLGAVGAVACAVSLSAAGTASAAKATKSPIQIEAMGTFAGVSAPVPQMLTGITAAVDAINADGGINGHPLKLSSCNDQDDPNVAQSCAEEAVSNHDVAVVTGNDAHTEQVMPVLQHAGIPMVGNITNTIYDATSPVSFPGAPGGYNGNGADAVAAKAAGCKKAVTVTVIVPGATATIEDTTVAGLKRAGVAVVKKLNVSSTATSFTSSVAAASAAGADCLVGVLTEPETTALMAQMRQSGGGMKLLVAGVNVSPLSTLDGVGNGTYMFSFSAVPEESNPPAALATVDKDLEKYGHVSGVQAIDPTGYTAFASVLLLADALRNVHGAYTAKTVLAAMGHLHDASSDGIYPPYTTSKSTGVKGENREFNPDAAVFKIEGTKALSVSGFRPIPGL